MRACVRACVNGRVHLRVRRWPVAGPGRASRLDTDRSRRLEKAEFLRLMEDLFADRPEVPACLPVGLSACGPLCLCVCLM